MKPNAITPIERTVIEARIVSWVHIRRDRRNLLERGHAQ